ncbi:MAG TPA: HAMP domain-containing sensor histidine kinase [Prolixibacteraceae bacterium]|nr:HAMP domain-containing sensor histidine kinase [Prolixibacteraceae bacterium]
MEEINVQLMNRVDKDANKLSEVISTNAKFLSIVAHDLRSPFNSIIGVLDILGDSFDEFSKAELEKLIHMASASAINTFQLLEDLLAWSTSQNKEKSINPVKIDLNEIITSEFESFSVSSARKQLSLEHSIHPKLFLTADIQMVKVIFRNLISNAIKYSNAGGVIFISAKEGSQFVEIWVKDHGIGISQKTKEKLFKADEFHSTTGTAKEQGTGFGLLFCKEFIEMHGGKIWVESETGKGSVFKFTLPHYI